MADTPKERPGLQYPVLPPATNPTTSDYVRNIFDNLYWLRGKVDAIPAELRTATQAAISQAISQAITNINNTVNNTFNGGLFIVGTHNTRLTTYGGVTQPVGTGFFETDRNVIYVITGPPKVWEFASGVMMSVFASRPSDLGLNDASFMFFATDTEEMSIWDGTQWLDVGAPQDFPYVVDTVALTHQTTELGPTAFTGTNDAGTYRVNYYLETTTLDALAGDVTLTIAWVDDAGATQTSSISLPLYALDRTSGIMFIQSAPSGGSGSGPLVTRGFLFGSRFIVTAGYIIPGAVGNPITYETTIYGSAEYAEYALYISVEKLS